MNHSFTGAAIADPTYGWDDNRNKTSEVTGGSMSGYGFSVGGSGFGEDATYSDVFSVTGDVILEETETVYDDAGNAIQTTHRRRYHDAPANQTGPLGSPSVTPKALITYSAAYPDAMGRPIAVADYGTHDGSAFTRSATIPARGDTVLVSSTCYNQRGEPFESIDPPAKECLEERVNSSTDAERQPSGACGTSTTSSSATGTRRETGRSTSGSTSYPTPTGT